MSGNPFAEPDDSDRTVVRPVPVHRPSPPAARPALPDPGEGASFADVPRISQSPVMSAAAPLLSLLARLRNVASVPDPTLLRERTVSALRQFEEKLRASNQPADVIRASHYALCASLDDVVRNTPWGSTGPWADISLVAAFHGEVLSGERFFDVLAQLRRGHTRLLPVIELMYVCMSLGMLGRYRLAQGPAELDRIREETYAFIMRQRQAAERALSPHWRGVSAPYRPLRASIPIWVAAIAGVGLVGLAYFFLALRLNESSDRLFESVVALPPGHIPAIVRTAPPSPVPPAPPPPDARAVFRKLLAQDIAQGLLDVVGTDGVPVLRIHAAGMFRSGSADIESRFLPVLTQIGDLLKTRGGSAVIAGYTDSQPIRTVAFPSNYQLSEARAKAAASVIGSVAGPGRLAVEGRADADPIASNDTQAGREQNRRIEIMLHGTRAE